MLNRDQAQTLLQKFLTDGTPIKAWAKYNELYLFRVEHQMPFETDSDPFFSVDTNTGEVRDFSVLTDLEGISKLNWTDI